MLYLASTAFYWSFEIYFLEMSQILGIYPIFDLPFSKLTPSLIR